MPERSRQRGVAGDRGVHELAVGADEHDLRRLTFSGRWRGPRNAVAGPLEVHAGERRPGPDGHERMLERTMLAVSPKPFRKRTWGTRGGRAYWAKSRLAISSRTSARLCAPWSAAMKWLPIATEKAIRHRASSSSSSAQKGASSERR